MKSLNTLIKIFDSFDEAIYIVDKHRKILYFNPIAEHITGFKSGEIIGKNCQNNTLNHVDDFGTKLCIKDCPLVKSIQNNVVNEHSIYLHHKLGYRVPVRVKTIPYLEDNEIIGGIEVFNLSNKEKFEENYSIAKQKLNYIDPLTKVFNRLFLDDLITGVYKINLFDYNVLFIDADNFKYVNDTFGHLVGDELLAIVSKTINLFLKPDEYILRFGGDEFIVFIKKDEDPYCRSEIIRKLVNKSSLRDHDYYPTISIGIYVTNMNDDIIKSIDLADKALYVAKSLGKNKTYLYK